MKEAFALAAAMSISSGAWALNTGDIAFVGFNGDGNDNLAFVCLVDIPASEVIRFTDKEWVMPGPAFNSGEGDWTWTAPASIVPEGTVVVINNIGGGTVGASTGTVTGTLSALSATDEAIFAIQGTVAAPTVFLAMITIDSAANGSILTGTGLVYGSTAIDFGDGSDLCEYTGSATFASAAAARTAIYNTANWTKFNTAGDDSTQLPFDAVGFSWTVPVAISKFEAE